MGMWTCICEEHFLTKSFQMAEWPHLSPCGLGRGVVRGVHTRHGACEDAHALWHQVAVILDALQPPPHGITAVESGTHSLTQQVGDQSVAQGASKRQNDVPAERKSTTCHISNDQQ